MKICRFGALVFLAASLSAQAAPSATDVVATVNGSSIRRAEMDLRIDAISNGKPVTQTAAQRVLDNLCMQKVIEQYAGKKNLLGSAGVRAAIERARAQVIAQAVASDYLGQHPVSEDRLKVIYQRQKEAYGDTEYRVRHIQVKTSEEAKKLIEQLRSGGSFEELAKAKSLDKATASRGGLLDWVSPSTFETTFATAFTSLDPGQLRSAPLKTPAGWHVIKLEGKRDAKSFPTWEQSKPRLRVQVSQQMLTQFFAQLRKDAKIVIRPDAFAQPKPIKKVTDKKIVIKKPIAKPAE